MTLNLLSADQAACADGTPLQHRALMRETGDTAGLEKVYSADAAHGDTVTCRATARAALARVSLTRAALMVEEEALRRARGRLTYARQTARAQFEAREARAIGRAVFSRAACDAWMALVKASQPLDAHQRHYDAARRLADGRYGRMPAHVRNKFARFEAKACALAGGARA